MLTLRRRSSLDAATVTPTAGRPVVLATLDVPFSEEATAFAVDSAVESGQPLVLVNVAEVLPTAYTSLGYGYVELAVLVEELVARDDTRAVGSEHRLGLVRLKCVGGEGGRAARGDRVGLPLDEENVDPVAHFDRE